MAKTFTDFDGDTIRVGDRVVPLGWGEGVPLYLASSPATVVGFGRTRIRVRFDGAMYGVCGKQTFPEYDTIGTYVRKVSSAYPQGAMS